MKKYFESQQAKMILVTFYLLLAGFVMIPAGAMIAMLILDLSGVEYSLTGVYVAVGLVLAMWLYMVTESILTYKKIQQGSQ